MIARRLRPWLAGLAGVAILTASGAAGAASCQLALLTVPIQMEGARPTIEVRINGQPTRLVVDTGAFFSMIPEAVAKQYGLKVSALPADLLVTGIGGSFTPGIATVRAFDLGGMPHKDFRFLVGGSDATGGAAGLLGQDILHVADVEYDFSAGVIRFARAKGCEDKSLAYWAKTEAPSVLPIEPTSGLNRRVAASAFVNGHKIKVVFDTGAQRSFLTFAAARRAGIDPNGPGVERMGHGMGVGRRLVDERLAPVDSFKIGDEEILHTRIPIGDSDFEADMLLGADFFLSHRVFIANSQGKIYFTYNGGPVFALQPDLKIAAAEPSAAPVSGLNAPGSNDAPSARPAPPSPAAGAPAAPPGRRVLQATSEPDPKDADGFGRRGRARLDRLEYATAIADLTRAHELAPKDAAWLFERARAYGRTGRPLLARADLDAAIALDPDAAAFRLGRAELELRTGAAPAARTDLAAADRTLAKQAEDRLELAHLYQQTGDFPAALASYDDWIAVHRSDARLGEALTGRCWALAGGSDSAAATAACDAALKRAGRNPAALSARGFAELKAREDVKAVADFDQALALEPHAAWALWGRALVEQKTGETQKAAADAAEARARMPRIAEAATRYGLPPGPPGPGRDVPNPAPAAQTSASHAP